MIVVADTTPLNYLILLGHIEVLKVLYGEILIPHAVHDEMLVANAPPPVRHWAQNPPVWVQFLSPSVHLVAEITNLDPGETEAIALAVEVHADYILIDETSGRAEAQKRGLLTVGTVGILRDAHRSGLLDFPKVLDQLRHLGFYISPQVSDAILRSL